MKVKLGMRVDLTQIPVNSIEVSQFGAPGMAPGQKSALVAKITQPDGTVLLTEGKGGGKVMWSDLQVTPEVVTADNKGNLSLAHDPRVSDGKTGHVTVTIPSHPGPKADLDIPFRYNVPFTANFSGAPGQNGSDGTNGIDGMSGSSGSTDPNNPSPGGNGSDGGNGGDGGNGWPGGDAPAVQVKAVVQPGSRTLIQVSVSAAGKQRFYLVDPNGGSLTVKADGGPGGRGGQGGRGGRGGAGGIGTPDGMSGSDGRNGQDGSAGPDGRGGLITVTYDPSVKPYLSAFKLSASGGPAPVWVEGTVAPLW
jgi:hypothetical protein